MHYLIDGYNLLFRQEGEGRNLEAKREALIRSISSSLHLLKLKGTLVFDAPRQTDAAALSWVGSLRIVYTDWQETADSWILSYLRHSQDSSRYTLVTADRDLAFQARQLRAKTISISTFLTLIDKKRKKQKASSSPIRSSPIAKMPGSPLNEEETRYLQAFENKGAPIETDFTRWLRLFEAKGKEE